MSTLSWFRFQFFVPILFVMQVLQQVYGRCSDEPGISCLVFRLGDSVSEILHETFFNLGLHSINSGIKEILSFLNYAESHFFQVSYPFLVSFSVCLFGAGLLGWGIDKVFRLAGLNAVKLIQPKNQNKKW